MKVVPVDFDLDLTQNAVGYVRTPGLHLSDIYGEYYRLTEPERYARTDTDPGTKAGWMGAGLALEEALERSLASRLSGDGRPGELVEPEHGIIYSPDLILWQDATPRVGEVKLTWMSSRGMPTKPDNGVPAKFNKYTSQMMLYGRCLGTRLARLYCLFINGNYDRKKGLKPEPRAFDFEFSQRELDEEWQTMMNIAKKAGMIK